MKQNIALAFLFSMINVAFSQSATEILRKSYEKCQAVQNGHYVVVEHLKSWFGQDTLATMDDCQYIKAEYDSLIPVHYNSMHYYQGLHTAGILYTGDELVLMSERDSTARIMRTREWADDIKMNYGHQNNVYPPLTGKDGSPLYQVLQWSNSLIELLKDETIRGRACHHIRAVYHPEPMHDNFPRTITEEFQFWITTADDIPIQYVRINTSEFESDTLIQYHKRSLKAYELNTQQDPSIFTLAAIPEYYQLKDFAPIQHADTLPNGTLAPGWTLPLLTGKKMSLEQQQGHLVLLDFFYNACAPCLMALPGLQSLHEKYSNQGLRVIGINAFDKSATAIADLMTKHGVTYPVLYDGQAVAEAYLAQGYPMLYLIDQNGIIIYSKSGFWFSMEEELDAEVRRALQYK